MKSALLTVLEFELKAIRGLRVSSDLQVARAALDREEVLMSEIASARGEETNVLPLAAGFARRAADPVEGAR